MIEQESETAFELDVSGVQPEARTLVERAARVYIEHLRPWFVGLVAHGSVMKGGIIPGCSDIDLQIYLDDAAFAEDGHLPFAACLDLHRDLAKIDPAPFRYIQDYAFSSKPRGDWVGPIPGAYQLVAGRLPILEATSRQLRASAAKALSELAPVPMYATDGLLDHGGGKLEARIRYLCTEVWPKLYQVLALQHEDPIYVWGLPKERAIELLPEGTPLGRSIREFYGALRDYYPSEASVDGALLALEKGVGFLQAAKSWWVETSGDNPDGKR